MNLKPLPIGVEDFQEIIQKNYYYVDKTLMIKELLDVKGKVTLFTRPRRFGKTLNMSMLQYFFDNTTENVAELFSDLAIMQAGENYLQFMGQYPVICLSLKSLKQPSYELAYEQLKRVLRKEFDRHWHTIKKCKNITDTDIIRYKKIMDLTGEEPDYYIALEFLSECLYKSYEQKVIILIDEYDVPLENAYFNGFYQRMSSLIRSLFESALKTNSNLEFAVITGCLRISKESIFTGLNNLKIMSITTLNYAEYFGFTQYEINHMLQYYGLESNAETVKKWYDGYLFGMKEVYNPWSIINYVDSCRKNPNVYPVPYWSNTSSNSIVHKLVTAADLSVKQELEHLIEGKTITKPIHEDITYEDIETSQDNLWNFLFFTGYLKKVASSQFDEIEYIEMAIPNSEVRYIYKTTILQWFEKEIAETDLSYMYESILTGNCHTVEKIFSEQLMETISFYDYKESFYHGFLAGLFKNMKNYIVLSNRESGYGRPDLILKYPSVKGKAIIFELKVADSYKDLEQKCNEALEQIEIQQYDQQLQEEGYQDIMKYGIAFYRKECMVKLKK